MNAQTPKTLEEIKDDLRRYDQQLKDLYWRELMARFGGETVEARRLFSTFSALVDKVQAESFARFDATETLTVATEKAFGQIQAAYAAGDTAKAQRLTDEWFRTYGPMLPPTV